MKTIDKKMLLWFYGWSEEPTIKECAEKAYRDFCRTLEFTISSTKLEKMKKDKKAERDAYINYIKLKNDFCDGVNSFIEEEIIKLSAENTTDFDGWHEGVCNTIISKARSATGLFKKENENGEDKVMFYYGQAQKWLNMTFKYMLIARDEKRNIIEKIENFLHIPIDKYTMKLAFYNLGVPLPSKEDRNKYFYKTNAVVPLSLLKANEKEYLYEPKNNFIIDQFIPWSQWDFEQYNYVQANFKKAISTAYPKEPPLDWEFERWLEERDKDLN